MRRYPEAVCFFWHEMALYVGPPVGGTPHAQFCIDLTLSLDGALEVGWGDGDSATELGGFLAGSNIPHQHRQDGRMMAKLIVGPLTRTGVRLRRSLGERPIRLVSRARVEPLREELASLLDCNEIDRAGSVARSVIEHFSPVTSVEPADRRVLSAMERLLAEFNVNSPVSELARGAGLSESRFSHLFRRDVGVPVRTYRRWLRLRAGLMLGLSGWDLRDAAHEAGFADQSDFSRICRQTFGIAPSTLTRRPTSVLVGPPSPCCSLMSSLVNQRTQIQRPDSPQLFPEATS